MVSLKYVVNFPAGINIFIFFNWINLNFFQKWKQSSLDWSKFDCTAWVYDGLKCLCCELLFRQNIDTKINKIKLVLGFLIGFSIYVFDLLRKQILNQKQSCLLSPCCFQYTHTCLFWWCARLFPSQLKIYSQFIELSIQFNARKVVVFFCFFFNIYFGEHSH